MSCTSGDAKARLTVGLSCSEMLYSKMQDGFYQPAATGEDVVQKQQKVWYVGDHVGQLRRRQHLMFHTKIWLRDGC